MIDRNRSFELFIAARRLPTQRQREALLRRECGADEELRSRIEDLLREDNSRGGLDGILEEVQNDPPGISLPERIGPYQILSLLGEGGMGIVYEAQQEHPHRTVAVKVIRFGLVTERMRRRFEFETDVLGTLQHPGIAQIYGAGTETTPQGSCPYFAMERIHGQTLLEYARDQRLSVRSKLELFLRICDAVHHAHQKGVIHRDLKPSNILITADGQPKILDFGIARSTNADLSASTAHTESQQVLGTPAYMSPEQAAGETKSVDLRSDLYSLGVILYELLAGTPPFQLDEMPPLRALWTTREKQPSPLGNHDRTCRGDLETIVGKALEKERERRYASLVMMAEDLRAYLQNRPISARPASHWYRFQKFCKRNRMLSASLGAVAVSLLAGLIVTGLLFNENRKQLIKTQFMVGLNEEMWRAADPYLDFSHNVTVREVLDHKSGSALQQLEQYPELHARFQAVLGETYYGLGALESARFHLERALQRSEESFGSEHRLTLTTRHNLAKTRLAEGKYVEAREEFQVLLKDQEHILGKEDPDTLITSHELARVLTHQGNAKEALEMHRQNLAIQERTLGDDYPDTLNSRASIAFLLMSLGQYEEARALHEEVLAAEQRTVGDDHPSTLTARHNIAWTLAAEGRHQEALAIEREVLKCQVQRLGEEHPSTLRTRNNMAWSLASLGMWEKATSIHNDVLRIQQRHLGPEHPESINSMFNLAAISASQGNHAAALRGFQQVLEARLRQNGSSHPKTFEARLRIAAVWESMGDLVLALKSARKTLEDMESAFGVDHPRTESAKDPLVRYLDRVEEDRRNQLARATKIRDRDPQAWFEAVDSLAWLLVEYHRFRREGALEEAADLYGDALDSKDWRVFESEIVGGTLRLHHGICQQELEELLEAEDSLCLSYQILDRHAGPSHAATRAALRALVRFYEKDEDKAKAHRYQELLNQSTLAEE